MCVYAPVGVFERTVLYSPVLIIRSKLYGVVVVVVIRLHRDSARAETLPAHDLNQANVIVVTSRSIVGVYQIVVLSEDGILNKGPATVAGRHSTGRPDIIVPLFIIAQIYYELWSRTFNGASTSVI